jgi:hypothetical protein
MRVYKHVNLCRDDAKAPSLDPFGRLIYRSNLLGSHLRTSTRENCSFLNQNKHLSLQQVYAAIQRLRELAMELSPLVRVNGVAPATVMQVSGMSPRDRVIGSLANYAIA